MRKVALVFLSLSALACTKNVTLKTPEGEFKTEYTVRDGLRFAEGDIVLSEDYNEPFAGFGPGLVGNGIVARQWPNAVMYYDVDPSLPNPERVTKAIKIWETSTAARFKRRTTETDYVYFTAKNGCYSHIGRTGGKQIISLDSGCSAGNAAHEIAHAFGIWHEQSRPDRDNHVTVNMQNVHANMRGNFTKVTGQFVRELSPYDYESIMHYPANAFCIDCSKPTITRKDGGKISGQRSHLSAGDVAGFAKLYPPAPAPVPSVVPVPKVPLAAKALLRGTYLPASGREHVRFGVEIVGDTSDVASVEFVAVAGLDKLPSFVAPFEIGTYAKPGWQAGVAKARLKDGKVIELPITVPER